MFQTADDFIIFLGWVFHNISLILKEIFLPIRYIFAFLRSAVVSAFGSPIESPVSYTFSNNVLQFFHQIPYFDYFVEGMLVALGVIALVSIFKMFQKV